MTPQREGRPGLAAICAAWACLGLGMAACARAQEKSGRPTLGTIERLDPRFDRLVPTDARVERIAEGFDWSEGPVWDRKQGRLLFSDVPMNTVFQWQEGKGVSVFLKPSGYTGTAARGGEPGSNGLLMDSQGRLVLCQHGDRRVARLDGDRFTTLADRYMGKRFNSPNDGVYKSNGDLYFTDPPYGLLGLNKDPAKELDFNGVYRISAADGTVTLLTKEMTFPNGIALSPDEKTLYVANSDPAKAIWMAFDVKDDGTIDAGRIFFDATEWVKAGKQGLPDGLKVDRDGNLFATGPGGVHVFTPDGTRLGTLDTGEKSGNCAWGDDGSTLYIMADMYICRIKTGTKGITYRK
jgi:gluconolactonase